MSFARPDLLWLCLLAPIVLATGAWFWRRRLQAFRAWAAPSLWQRLDLSLDPRRLVLALACLTLAVLGIAVATARPRWGTIEQRLELRGLDIVFVVDSSLSMQARDVTPSRMSVARALVRRLVSSLPGHRFALVQAEGDGLVLAPLTVDSAIIDLLLDTVTPASLPTPGTKLAKALEVGRRLFPPAGERHRVMIVLSDGEDHGSRWRDELSELLDSRVVVHAVGIGSQRGAPIELAGEQAPRYKHDASGKVVISRLHADVLRELADASGGSYLEVGTPSVDPGPIVDAIDSMQKTSIDGTILDVQAERFQWPLGVALAALTLLLALPLSSGSARRGSDAA